MQVLYKSGVQEGIPNLLDLKAEVFFARADRLQGMAADGLVNQSDVKVLAQVCCSAVTALSIFAAMMLLDACIFTRSALDTSAISSNL